MPHERVAHLVVGRDQALFLAHHARLLLGAGDHAHDPLLELFLADLALARARRQQRRLVDQVRQVRAGEARRLPGERVDVDHLRQRLSARVDLEDLRAPLAVGPVDGDLAVEAAGAQQRRVEDVGAVGRRDHDDVVLRLEAVHLDEQLVERLLALVVTAAKTRATVAPDGVDLVHEDDARAVLLGLLEQVAHARGADADEHLDEVRAGDREERHARLARHGAREQRLTGARRPVQQHAGRYSRAERLELLRVLEEFLDLVELLDGLVDAGDVTGPGLRRAGRQSLRARLAERHHFRAAALDLVHQEDPEAEEQDERNDVREQAEQRAALFRFDVVRDAVRAQFFDQFRRGLVDVADFVRFFVLQLDFERLALVLELDFADFARRQLFRDERLVAVRAVVARARIDQFDREERQHDDDQDRERGALEETAHRIILGGLAPAEIGVTSPLAYHEGAAIPVLAGRWPAVSERGI